MAFIVVGSQFSGKGLVQQRLKDRKIDSLLASIGFEVQSGSREDFVGLGRDRRTSSVVLVHIG